MLECIDGALDEAIPVRKQELYDMFFNCYKMTYGDIPNHYGEFVDLLFANLTRKDYFKVIRLIVQILHERATYGSYRETDAIEAFGQIVEVNIQRTQQRLQHSKENFNDQRMHELRKIIENQNLVIRDAERLSAIGQTAAMVGHDIRNPLQSIIGEVYLAKETLESLPEEEAKKCLKENFDLIEENIVYIDKIVSDLQDYARPIKPDLIKINLEKIITSSLNSVSVPGNIHTSVTVNDSELNLNLDPVLMKRVLINLITNAVQAMPNGGELTIQADKTDNKTSIIIQDTGIGIPEGIKDKLFKPMFTTKSKGQGFGLAVSKRLIELQGGKIFFESEPEKGTCFILEF